MFSRTAFPRSGAVALLLLFVALVGCQEPAADRERAEYAASTHPADTLIVGAPWPWEARAGLLYRQGLELARVEINAAGGVLQRPVRVRYVDDRESVDHGRLVAQQLADDARVVAVVGHLQSYTTLPAAAIYERAGLLLLAPSATDPALTARGYRRVFRTTPSNDAIGRHIAGTAAARGHRRVLLCYVDSDYGRALANAFEQSAAQQGLAVVLRQSYSPDLGLMPSRLRQVVEKWKDYTYDAVVLTAEVPHAALLIQQARAAGVEAPILGSDAMAVPALLQVGGDAVEGVEVPTRFLSAPSSPPVRRFVQAFQDRFRVPPDLGSAAAYDALHLWAHAVALAGTAQADSVASVLRHLPPWTGVTGPLAFDDAGDLSTAPLQTTVVRNGAFHPR